MSAANIFTMAILGSAFTCLGINICLTFMALRQHFADTCAANASQNTLDAPLVSVLVPCFNEQVVIGETLQHILRSRWASLEVIAINDGSIDDTLAIMRRVAQSDRRVRVINLVNEGKAQALNAGLLHASGDFILTVDADTVLEPDTIGHLMARLAPQMAAVSANILVYNRSSRLTRLQETEYVLLQNLERRCLAAFGAATVVPGACGLWRRSWISDCCGFSSRTVAEDQDLTLRVQARGARIGFAPKAYARTEAVCSLRGLVKQRTRWSLGLLQCLLQASGYTLGKRGMALVALLWMIKIIAPMMAALIDLACASALISLAIDPQLFPVAQNVTYCWLSFVLVDLLIASAALPMEPNASAHSVISLLVTRIFQRQLTAAAMTLAFRRLMGRRQLVWEVKHRTPIDLLAPLDR